MKKGVLFFLSVLFVLQLFSQTIQFKIKYSPLFATYTFIENLSENAPPNIFKKKFASSAYNTTYFNDLVAKYDSLQLEYPYRFPEYPYGQKIEGSTLTALKRNMIAAVDIKDFINRSMGLIPNNNLQQLALLLKIFSPVYEDIIYNPSKQKFTKQLRDITNLVKVKNVSGYFNYGITMFQSSIMPLADCRIALPITMAYSR
jgi:hypothetical protein